MTDLTESIAISVYGPTSPENRQFYTKAEALLQELLEGDSEAWYPENSKDDGESQFELQITSNQDGNEYSEKWLDDKGRLFIGSMAEEFTAAFGKQFIGESLRPAITVGQTRHNEATFDIAELAKAKGFELTLEWHTSGPYDDLTDDLEITVKDGVICTFTKDWVEI